MLDIYRIVDDLFVHIFLALGDLRAFYDLVMKIWRYSGRIAKVFLCVSCRPAAARSTWIGKILGEIWRLTPSVLAFGDPFCRYVVPDKSSEWLVSLICSVTKSGCEVCQNRKV